MTMLVPLHVLSNQYFESAENLLCACDYPFPLVPDQLREAVRPAGDLGAKL
jgi:hypothetical protein